MKHLPLVLSLGAFCLSLAALVIAWKLTAPQRESVPERADQDSVETLGAAERAPRAEVQALQRTTPSREAPSGAPGAEALRLAADRPFQIRVERYGTDATAIKVAEDVCQILKAVEPEVEVVGVTRVISNLKLRGVDLEIAQEGEIPESVVAVLQQAVDELDDRGFPARVRESTRVRPQSVRLRVGELEKEPSGS